LTLLYQNQAGDWHLVDWKTDYVKNNDLASLNEKYKMQISVYFHAVSNILKRNPKTQLIFLNPKTYVIDIEPKEMDFLKEIAIHSSQ
jgi:ATP-dependent exoDNAse (exonuclease V) beta subunit